METPSARLATWMILAAFTVPATSSAEAPPATAPATNEFATQVVPFLNRHCNRCHGGKEPHGELSLERFRESANVQQEFTVWQNVLKMTLERQMPPEDEPQPTAAEIQAVVSVLQRELAKFDCSGDEKHPGRVTIRRLNRVEYNNTVRDLIGVDFQPAAGFPSDDVGYGFDNIGDVLSIPPVLLEKYLAAAEQIVERAFQDQACRARLLPIGGEAALQPEAARENLSAFTFRAFRRPPQTQELDRLIELMKFARAQGSSDEEAFRTALTAVLTSPHFLFRVEADPEPDDPDGIRELNDFERATRLSYFLWSSMPDEELFALARQGQLGKSEILDQQIHRMLHDAKAWALIKNFAGQWLQLRDLKNMTPDPERFPDFDEELRGDAGRNRGCVSNHDARKPQHP